MVACCLTEITWVDLHLLRDMCSMTAEKEWTVYPKFNALDWRHLQFQLFIQTH